MFETLPETSGHFYRSILGNAVAALKLNTFFDNFDAGRFNCDGSDHSKEFDVGASVFWFDWFFRNSGPLYEAYSRLGDEESRRLYLFLIAYRLGGHLAVRLPVDFRGERYLDYQTRELCSESRLDVGGMFGKLKHFDFDFEGGKYIVDCLGLEYYLHRQQYFLARGPVAVRPEPGDFVVDGGACLGDTAAVFSNAVGRSGRVYAFDPVAEHLEILRYNAGQFPLRNVSVLPFGLADADVDAEPIRLNAYAPGFSSVDTVVPLRTIDGLVDSCEIARIDFLKLDVEGFEMKVLAGGLRAIVRFRPKLAISLYHKPDDLFELIAFISDRFGFYDLHIGHYTIHREETVLYCRPRR